MAQELTAHALTGTWHDVYAEVDGEMAAAAYVSGIQLTFHGERFSVTVHDKVEHEGTYSVNDKNDPRQITLVYTKSSHFELNKPRTGIAQLTGDTFKLCLGAVGAHPPSALNTTPKSSTVLTVFRKKGLEGGTPVAKLKVGVLW